VTTHLYTQDNLRITLTTPLGPNPLLFKTLKGQESLSQPFHFTVEMLSQNHNLNFTPLIGQPLGVTIQFPEDHQRHLNGIVTRFTQLGRDARFSVYQAELRPQLWPLTLSQNCRIFQKQTVPEILAQIFAEFHLKDYRFRLVYNYEPRDYCVQYQETSFNFINRLMEDEGLFYFFEHQADKHTLIIADYLSAHPDCPGIDTVRFWHSPNDTTPEDVITHCQFSQQLVSGQYAVDDFNFEIPATRLRSQVGGPYGEYRIYEYGSGHGKRAQGDNKVRRRIEAEELAHQMLEGQSYCFSFTAGHQFQLTQHFRIELNRAYVLRQVIHDLSLTHYQNHFQAFPAEMPFRSPITTPKPKMMSTQTAIVTGPSGEEIWTDKYGRIKVQFHWDQQGQYDENSSCWIRVNQGWAGKSWGHLSLPRIGQEVIVSFINGNPDTPIVTGAVYNAQHVVPYPLPAQQTKSTFKSLSTKGGLPWLNYNEFRFEDKKGLEEVYLQAEKDWNTLVKNDKTQNIQNDETLTVDHDRTRTVHHDEQVTVDNDRRKTVHHDEQTIIDHDHTQTVSHDEHLVVAHDRTRIVHHDEYITINNNRNQQVNNNQHQVIGVDQNIAIGHNQTETVGNNQTEQVGNTLSRQVGGHQNETIGGNHHVEVGGRLNLKVGRNKTDFTSIASAETVGLAKALTVGAAYQVSVGGIMNETVGGMKSVQVGFSKSEIVGGSHTTQANEVIIEARQKLVLKCGGSTITLDEQGNIVIQSAAQVIINSE